MVGEPERVTLRVCEFVGSCVPVSLAVCEGDLDSLALCVELCDALCDGLSDELGVGGWEALTIEALWVAVGTCDALQYVKPPGPPLEQSVWVCVGVGIWLTVDDCVRLWLRCVAVPLGEPDADADELADDDSDGVFDGVGACDAL